MAADAAMLIGPASPRGVRNNMVTRVYFCADNVSVSGDCVAVGPRVFPITDILAARCERVRLRWLWPLPVYCFALVLTMVIGHEVRPVRRRNAYFVFQLVNAVQSAIDDSQQQPAVPLAGNSSA